MMLRLQEVEKNLMEVEIPFSALPEIQKEFPEISNDRDAGALVSDFSTLGINRD